MFDLVSSNRMIATMDRSMTLASQRMALIASNLANIDTPGYRTRDFSFQDALKQELGRIDGNALPMARTHEGHLAPAPDPSPAAASGSLRPAWERNDGNDVNLDRETTLLARTQSAYSLSASFAQTELRKLYQVIRDGSR
ncbi:MAG TPA: flagellar basal body rod protein FlgB [Holophaga sp.]|mgnify:FL=1|nr:flagellar basal body rod protein FlgB [Holophaga sp.]